MVKKQASHAHYGPSDMSNGLLRERYSVALRRIERLVAHVESYVTKAEIEVFEALEREMTARGLL